MNNVTMYGYIEINVKMGLASVDFTKQFVFEGIVFNLRANMKNEHYIKTKFSLHLSEVHVYEINNT